MLSAKLPNVLELQSSSSTKFSTKLRLKRLHDGSSDLSSFQNHHLQNTMAFYKNDYLRTTHPHFQKPLTAREHTTRRTNNLSKSIDTSQESNKLQLSRAFPEQSKKPDPNFSYISQFYQKPIQREMAVRKQKKQAGNFIEILNIFKCKPQRQEHPPRRSPQTISSRCRCRRNTQAGKFKEININAVKQSRASHKEKEEPQNELIKNRVKQNRRKVISLNKSQNWSLESWNDGQAKPEERQGMGNESPI